jgi:hypothetical protein
MQVVMKTDPDLNIKLLDIAVEAESGVGRVYKRLSSKPRLFEKPIS